MARPFRARLLLALSLFALLPALVVTAGWMTMTSRVLPLVGGRAAWERVAETGRRALDAAREAALDAPQRRRLDAHEAELEASVTQARRFSYLSTRLLPVVLVGAVVGLVVLWIAASRVAGHLARQMSRPLDEVVRWTGTIARGEPLPAVATARGAPEFTVLRDGMRRMSDDLAEGRRRALEAERLRAYRETAQRVAHELKNPLTPMQFAIARLRAEAGDRPHEALDILATETQRLAALAASFAQFGRLPAGPRAAVDLVELARYTAQACAAPGVAIEVATEGEVPMVEGHYDALQRALGNVVLNAVDACAGGGRIRVHLSRARLDGAPAVALHVTDSGPGIPAEVLPSIWDPYVTQRPGGTGLGLAIARQAVLAHGGRVAAESPPGVGATITFLLPVVPHAECT